jgi:hypothetical protein
VSLNKVSEDVHYSLIPIEEAHNQQAWAVRLLEGPHPETVIRLGNVAFDPDGDCLKFNFMIESSPDSELTEDDSDLQNFVADVLEDILEKAIEDGSLATREKSED